MIQILLLLLSFSLFSSEYNLEARIDKNIVLSTKRIVLPKYPDAFNPSLFKGEQGYILSFRYCPDWYWDPWTNYIGVVLLNDSFEPISEPEILLSGLNTVCVKSQAEDARIFTYQNRIYLIYNDNVEVSRPWYRDRRDMYIAELKYIDNHFTLVHPVKLFYEQRYYSQLWQKNWTPFEWNNKLFLGYTLNPHEIIYANLNDGACYPCYETIAQIEWNLGVLRGSSPAVMVDGEYFSFFHAGHQMKTSVSPEEPLWHYFMGAYTFSANPPFNITKMSPEPIIGEGFYARSSHQKYVILPGGFVISGSRIYVTYGKDDDEMWIAEMSKEALMKSLIPVKERSL
jgi:predicted GH43/DUF377 family glycosyl hydrolase